MKRYPNRICKLFAATVAAALVAGCGSEDRNFATAANRESAAPTAEAAQAPAEDAPRVLFLGTSLTAGYGLAEENAFPARIQAKIDSAGLPFKVVNAGQSGETSAGALRRVDWLLRQPFDVLVLETGANDMLQGQNLARTRDNLQAIIDRVRAERPDARIVLVGMLAPPNLGRDYAAQFGAIYPELAERNDLPLVPFLLEDVGGERELNLADGIHPNAAGQRRVAATVWQTLEPVLRVAAAAG